MALKKKTTRNTSEWKKGLKISIICQFSFLCALLFRTSIRNEISPERFPLTVGLANNDYRNVFKHASIWLHMKVSTFLSVEHQRL